LQAEALLERLAREAAGDCERETSAGTERARALLRDARREARRLVREAVAEERARLEHVLTQARASAETRRRQAAQREAGRAVAEGWARLPARLDALWREAPTREAWCRAAIRAAAERLRGTPWQLAVAAPVDASELAALREDAARALAVVAAQDEATAAGGASAAAPSPLVDVRVDATLGAGLTIRAAGAVLDATTRGLLAARDSIEAELHAAWLGDDAP
jgi:vacuolar-type H+-ATPase subunit H